MDIWLPQYHLCRRRFLLHFIIFTLLKTSRKVTQYHEVSPVFFFSSQATCPFAFQNTHPVTFCVLPTDFAFNQQENTGQWTRAVCAESPERCTRHPYREGTHDTCMQKVHMTPPCRRCTQQKVHTTPAHRGCTRHPHTERAHVIDEDWKLPRISSSSLEKTHLQGLPYLLCPRALASENLTETMDYSYSSS